MLKKILLLILLTLVGGYCSLVTAATPYLPLGEARVVAQNSQHLFWASGMTLHHYLITANRYVYQNSFNLSSKITAIATDQDSLYVGTLSTGLVIFEINSTKLIEKKQLKTSSSIWDIYLQGNLMFLACGEEGVIVFNRLSTTQIYQIPPQRFAWKVAYHNSVLYIIDGSSNTNLFLYEFKSTSTSATNLPFAIQEYNGLFLEGFFLLPPSDFNSTDLSLSYPPLEYIHRHLSTINRGNRINNIVIKNQHLYVADGRGGLAIYNVKVPATPRFVKSITPQRLAVNPPLKEFNYLHLTIENNLLICGGNSEMHLFDFKYPAELTFRQSYPLKTTSFDKTPYEAPHFFSLSNNKLYIAVGGIGLEILQPSDDTLKLNQTLKHPARINSIAFQDEYLFISSTATGIWSIPLYQEYRLNNYLNLTATGIATNIKISGNFLIASLGIGIAYYNLDNPANPTFTHFLPFPYPDNRPDVSKGWVNHFDTANNIIYASAGRGGLWIIDNTDPHKPQTLSQLQINDYINYITVDPLSSRLYAFGNQRVFIVNIFNPRNPSILRQIQIPEPALCGISQGPYLYVPVSDIDNNRYSKLLTYEVSSPFQPNLKSEIPLNNIEIYDLALIDNQLYLAAGSAGLFVFNLAAPEKPELITIETFADNIRTIKHQNSHLILSGNQKGLYRYEIK